MSASEDATISEGDLLMLPEEVQEMVLDHLDVKDLVSCSKVCRLWRSRINVSHIWKKWCHVESYDPTLMETHGEDLIEDEEFSNMGWWRKVYCWHAKLEMNWRRSLFTKFKLIDMDSTDSCVFRCFAADGDVAATGHRNASVVVWSMRTPPAVIGRVQGVLSSSPISFVRFHGNLLVVAQGGLIQVFQKADDNYELTDLKCIEMGEANVDQMENFVNHKTAYSSWYLECLREYNIRVTWPRPYDELLLEVYENSVYVSYSCSTSVWAWTLPRGEVRSFKVHAEVIQISKDQDAVYIVTFDLMEYVTYLMKFEVGSEAPSVLFSVPGDMNMIVGDELVLAHPTNHDIIGNMTLWAYKKGDYSQPIGTRTVTTWVAAIIHPNLVVYYENYNVTVWDPVSNANCAYLELNAPVDYLKPTFASFLLTCTPSSLCLWDWRKEKLLYRIYNGPEWACPRYRPLKYSDNHLLWANATTMLSRGVSGQLEMISFR